MSITRCYTWIKQNQNFQPPNMSTKSNHLLLFFNKKLGKSWNKKQEKYYSVPNSYSFNDISDLYNKKYEQLTQTIGQIEKVTRKASKEKKN